MPPMPPVVMVSNREEDSVNTEPSMSGRQVIGIIYPPPDIRKAANPRFSFLSATDPYNAYYQHKVIEFRDGKATEPSVPRPQIPEAVKEHVKQAEFVPRNPPPPFEFDADPATINAFDLDLIKLTALFVARNGRQFLTSLMNRESRNYQFDFLKPQHSNFSYFTKLVEQYTKILENVRYRVGWEKYQRAQKEKEDAEIERERIAYAQIDWHDFVVVQTVDFPINDTATLPPFCTPKDVGARILMQQRQEAAAKAAAEQAIEMDVESDSDEEHQEIRNEVINGEIENGNADHERKAPYEVTQPMPAPPSEETVVIRDYDPKKSIAARKAADKWIISPLTGERIPADKLQEHMRYNTVDSQYKEQRERELSDRNEEEPVYAPGADISTNIGKFAERRTDIFGHGAEQTIIGKKLGEEEEAPRGPDPKLIWDGQQSTIDQTTKLAQQSVTLDQQINEIHKQHGYIADPSKERIGPGAVPPPPVQIVPPPTTTVVVTATTTTPSPITTTAASTTTPTTAVPKPPVPTPRPPVPPSQTTPTPVPPTPAVRPPVIPQIPIRPPPPGFSAIPFPGTPMPMPPMPMPVMRPPIGVPMIPVPVIPQTPLTVRPTSTPVTAPIPPPTTSTASTVDTNAAANASAGDGPPPTKKLGQKMNLKVTGSITVTVQIPSTAPNPEWKLDGRRLSVSMDIAAPISTLKNFVQDETGLPCSKQKLSYEVNLFKLHYRLFLKDACSLAYYNMNTGAVVQLLIKERGGKKKIPYDEYHSDFALFFAAVLNPLPFLIVILIQPKMANVS
ncbi:splicing factor 3a, subunit 1 (SF3A1) [Dirofilaria immitis]|nr:splicing factor 3a, subunit 1 (SF3A1) [Dirofilaria immitis]